MVVVLKRQLGHFRNAGASIAYSSLEGKKLKNAYEYLIDCMRRDKRYFTDNDPFSPWNYTTSVETSRSKSTLKLSNRGGVSELPVKFGSVSVNMILDSGASDVTISKSLETRLIRAKFISKEDYIEPALYRVASGEIIACNRFICPEIKVGDITLYNIMCSVSPSNDILLLGQSFLENFTSWKINNESNELELVK